MTSDINKLLKNLGIEAAGHYDDHFYIIDIPNSDDYARMYSTLEKNAVNTEYPSFGTNSNNSTIKITNYFEFEEDNITYDLFLIADFNKDKYYLKIKERN